METARKLFNDQIEKLSRQEREVVDRFIKRQRAARNVAQEFEDHLSLGQRVADGVAATMGSWRFIIIQSVLLALWVGLNITAVIYHWDPYPFILLNLALSFQAAYAAPIIMMSQNRQAEKDRLQSKYDFDIDTKAELEILQLHEKFNELTDRYWVDLVAMQQRQIEMLERLLGDTVQGRIAAPVSTAALDPGTETSSPGAAQPETPDAKSK